MRKQYKEGLMLGCILWFKSVSLYSQPTPEVEKTHFRQALTNCKAANEAFRRSHRFLLGWLRKADPAIQPINNILL